MCAIPSLDTAVTFLRAVLPVTKTKTLKRQLHSIFTLYIATMEQTFFRIGAAGSSRCGGLGIEN